MYKFILCVADMAMSIRRTLTMASNQEMWKMLHVKSDLPKDMIYAHIN